ncbi:response regulator transcription factor [Kibdelosporangium philippinense]|uniref:response regulator transcription factor n=1 Tax=Kibdelosporangium philippinense TaxID=211113 RepID=UPI00360EA90D
MRTGLERDGRATVVAEAADVPTACRMADQARPDVALIDLRLRPHPDERTGQGVSLISHLRQRRPEVRVLMLSQAGPVLPAELAAHLIGELHRHARPLTSRERDVLRCPANGYDNQEIAMQLHIAVRTVNRHLENIRDKLGRTRRCDLIRIAHLTPWNS